MHAGKAKDIARRWVMEHRAGSAGFAGAYFSGSINWLNDEEEVSAFSDIDLWLVYSDGAPTPATGKRAVDGVVLDVAVTPLSRLQSPEAVLADYHVAPAFLHDSVMADPTGRLTALHRAVSADFARERWVRARCEHARAHCLRYVRSWRDDAPLHEQVLACAFAAGVMTHVLLSAGMRNPTVRRRYVDVRALLERCDLLEFHEELLSALGAERVTRDGAEAHLRSLGAAFDAAAAVMRGPVPFASDISAAGRTISIDGSHDLIARGQHREAMFWVLVTAARCQQVLANDGGDSLIAAREPAFRSLLEDVGVATSDQIRVRLRQVEDLLPRVWAQAERIIREHPDIRD